MTPARVVVAAIAIALAVLVQVSLLSRLGLPGATPDLVLVTVMALAFVRGPVPGASIGFAAGIVLDLVPPSLGYFGLSAILLAVAGYVAGLVAERSGGVVAVSLITVALGGVGLVLGKALLGSLLGDPRVIWAQVPLLAITEAVYVTLLAALVVPAVAAVDRLLEPGLAL